MARRLATAVVITDSNGLRTTYKGGTVPPDDVAELITNPDAWVEDEGPAPVSVPVVGRAPEAERGSAPIVPPGTTELLTPTAPAPAEGEQPEGSTGEDGGEGEGGEGDSTPAVDANGTAVQPARNGATDAWRAYARGLGQEVADDAKREAIIEQLDAAGLLEK